MDREDIERKVTQSGGEITELKATVKQLTSRLERHALVIQVLKDMLLSSGKFDEANFFERLSQAAADKEAAKLCRKCGKAMSPKHNRCIYCGEERPPELL